MRSTARLARRVARDPTLRLVLSVARDTGARLRLVGGAVRDTLLGRPLRDADFVLWGRTDAFLGALGLRLGRKVVTFRKRGIIDHRLTWRGLDLDFVELGGRRLDAELRRRDFTLNALAFDPDEKTLADPTGGLQDLRRGVIRTTSRRILTEDPVRMLRGVRLAAEIPELHLARETCRWIRDEAPCSATASPERVREELDRILASPRPSWGVRELDRLGLLAPWVPEVEPLRGLEQNRYHHLDAWEHTLAALEAADRPGVLGRGVIPRGSLSAADHTDLRWALLLHDLGKAGTRERGGDGEWRFFNHHLASDDQAAEVLARLRFSRRRTARIRRLVREHLRIALTPGIGLSPRAMRRIIRDLGTDTPLLVLHALADKAATRGRGHADTRRRLREAGRQLLGLYREQAAALLAPPRLIDGRTILAITGRPPGPEVGQLLREIRELQLDGIITTATEARAYVRDRRAGHGPAPRRTERGD